MKTGRRRAKRLLGRGMIGLGALLAVGGLWAIGGYVWGVIAVLGEPDRSWIFWGLALVVVGLGALGLGGAIALAGRALVRANPP